MGSTIAPPTVGDRLYQQQQALREANRVKLGRATMLRRMAKLSPAESCLEAADAIEDPPDVLASLSVIDLINRVRRIGPTATDRLLGIAQVSPLVQLRSLTATQRAALATALRFRAEGYRVAPYPAGTRR